MTEVLCRLPNHVGDCCMTLPALKLLEASGFTPVLTGKRWAEDLLSGMGWRFDPCSYGFIEPQVELTYGRIEGDTFTTKNAAQVSQDDFDSLIGRVGVRFGVKFPKDRGDLYLRVSGAHDFQGENKADVRAVNGAARQKLSEDLGGSWVETALGGNFRLSDATNVYVDLERTTGAKVEENWRWNLGIRTEF